MGPDHVLFSIVRDGKNLNSLKQSLYKVSTSSYLYEGVVTSLGLSMAMKTQFHNGGP